MEMKKSYESKMRKTKKKQKKENNMKEIIYNSCSIYSYFINVIY